MLWVPSARLLVLHTALPLLRATAAHPVRALPFSVKPTLPVGFAPVTVAVIATFTPAVAGLGALVKLVVVDAKPPAAVPQASISVSRDQESVVPVTLTRIRSVVKAVKLTVRLTRLLALTLAKVTQLAPFQPATVKAVTP